MRTNQRVRSALKRAGFLPLAVSLAAGLVCGQNRNHTTDASAQESRGVSALLIADSTSIAPASTVTVGVNLDIPRGFYTYYKSPGSLGVPPEITISAPPGYKVGTLQFPGPEVKYEEIGDTPIALYVYRGKAIILASVTSPDSLRTGDVAEISARVSYQYCKDSGLCFPPKAQTLKLSLPVVATRAEMKPSQAARAIAAAQQALPEPGHAGKHAKVKAVLDRDRMRPGDEATLGVVVDVDAGHKLQMHRPPVKGLISTDLILNSVLGIKSFRYPNYPAPKAPKTQTSGVPANPEYRDQFVITVPVVATDSLSGPVVKFTGLLRYQACTLSGACYAPQYASFELEVPVAAKGALVSPANQDVFAPK